MVTSNWGWGNAHDFVHEWERGTVDHPADPGGLTVDGVTQVIYDRYRARIHAPLRPVTKSTKAERDAIFKQDFWDQYDISRLPPSVALWAYDSVVNLPARRAIKGMQEILGVTADGFIGPITEAAARRNYGVLLIKALILWRQNYYHTRVVEKPAKKEFLKGWLRRVDSLKKEMLRLL